ncbi:hypothetical protein LTR53_012596, partial [Teratosphaeriaceae sp. CCFEE 6253]
MDLLSQPPRVRTNSNLSVRSIDQRAGIRKPSLDRARSISTSHVDRLSQLALHPADPSPDDFEPSSQTPASAGFQWITPGHSPQPQTIFADPYALEPFPTWSVPTPPHSDSGLPTVSIGEEDVTAGLRTPQAFVFDPPSAAAEMSSLGLLLPSQYGGTGLFESEPATYSMEPNYIPPMKASQPGVTM